MFVAGIVGASVTNVANVVINTSTGQLGLSDSSARYKDDIRDMRDQSQRLGKLRPVNFRYKADESATEQYGLIAEEVSEVYPELVATNAEGQVQTVNYQALIPVLLKEVQLLRNEVERLKAQVGRPQIASR